MHNEIHRIRIDGGSKRHRGGKAEKPQLTVICREAKHVKPLMKAFKASYCQERIEKASVEFIPLVQKIDSHGTSF